ncbi:MAG: hypothetical protein ABIN94_01155 [Ferruginibacter sp.]
MNTYKVVALEQYKSENPGKEDNEQLFVQISEITGQFDIFHRVGSGQHYATAVVDAIKKAPMVLNIVIACKDGCEKKLVVEFK